MNECNGGNPKRASNATVGVDLITLAIRVHASLCNFFNFSRNDSFCLEPNKTCIAYGRSYNHLRTNSSSTSHKALLYP